MQPYEILEKQRALWESGHRTPVEELVREYKLQSDSDTVMDLVYAEVLLREDRGESPLESEYQSRFPELKESLARQFQLHRACQTPENQREHLTESDTSALTIPSGEAVRVDDQGVPQIPGFDVQRVLGRGGAGVAYLAKDRRLNRSVAIKLLDGFDARDQRRREQLVREAEAAASLEHPNIVRVFQVGEAQGLPFLVMEFISGGSLADRLRGRPLLPDDAVSIARGIADAVHHAHQNGVIHRDLKPGNVLLDVDLGPHICDFGLARKIDSLETLHATGDVIGTPAYMAPEQARGERVDERCDVYSIGAILYESLCGRSPFQAATPWEIINQVIQDDPVSIRQLNSAIPKDLETICQKCLSKEPVNRYSTAGEIADELRRYQNGEPILARPISTFRRVTRWCRRNARVAALAATSLGLLLVLGIGSAVAALWLSAANRSINAERHKALAAEQQAQQDRTAAISSLDSLVNSLYRDLATMNAPIQVREKVANAAISGLQSITQLRDDENADRTTVLAYQRIGDLFSLRGDEESAIENFEKAIRMARERASANPENLQIQLGLIHALDHLLTHKLRNAQTDGARGLQDEIMSTLRKSQQIDSNDENVMSLLIGAHSREVYLLDLLGKHSEILNLEAEILEDQSQFLKVATDPKRLSTAQTVNAVLGLAHIQNGDPEMALVQFEHAKSILDRALELSPGNAEVLFLRGVNNRMRGVTHGLAIQTKESLECFDQALRIHRKLADADPDNETQVREVANVLVLRSVTLYQMGKLQEAIDDCDRAISIYTDLAGDAPSYMYKGFYIESFRAMIRCLMSLGDFEEAIARYDAMLELVGTSEDDSQGEFAEFRADSLMRQQALKRVLDVPVESPIPDGDRLAACLLVAIESQQADEDQLDGTLRERISKLIPIEDGDSLRDVFEFVVGHAESDAAKRRAKELWIVASALRARNAKLNSGSQAEVILPRTLELIREYEAEFPADGYQFVNTQFELQWLRSQPEFASIRE